MASEQAITMAEAILADARDRRRRLEIYLADARADEAEAAEALQRLQAGVAPAAAQAENRPAMRSSPRPKGADFQSQIDMVNKIQLVKSLLWQARTRTTQLEREQPGEGSLRDAWLSGLEAARMREVEIEAVLAKTWKEKTQWEQQVNKLLGR